MLPSKRQIIRADRSSTERWVEMIQMASGCGRGLRRSIADSLSDLDLNDSEFFVLFSCHRNTREGAAQRELASAVGLSPAQLCGLVERLGRRGLMTSYRDETDRRKQFWRLTEAGRQLLLQALDQLNSVAQRLDDHFQLAQQHTLTQLLCGMTDALRTVPLPHIYRDANRDTGGPTS